MAKKLLLQQIAKMLGRSEAAIRVQAWKIGLSLKSKAAAAVRPEKLAVREQSVRNLPDPVELVVAPGGIECAPAAIERALGGYEQLQPHEPFAILQARKILAQHIFEWSTRASKMRIG
jgi:hypothetical protein